MSRTDEFCIKKKELCINHEEFLLNINDEFHSRTIRPIEIPAEKGDVIFWHGRLVHTVGRHMSVFNGKIRFSYSRTLIFY